MICASIPLRFRNVKISTGWPSRVLPKALLLIPDSIMGAYYMGKPRMIQSNLCRIRNKSEKLRLGTKIQSMLHFYYFRKTLNGYTIDIFSATPFLELNQ